MRYSRVLGVIYFTICALLLPATYVSAQSTPPVLKPFQPIVVNMRVVGGKCGFIDLTGKYVIPAKYDDAHSFDQHGLAWVRQGKKSQFIDRTGRVVFNLPDNTSSYGFNNHDLAQFFDYEWENAHSGFVNLKGEIVVPKIWKSANADQGAELIAVEDDTEKWGFINLKGEVVISPRFDSAEELNNGSYLVTLDDVVYRMEKAGNLTEIPNVEETETIIDGAEILGDKNAKGYSVARVESGSNYLFGLIGPDGKMAIKPKYDDLKLDEDQELFTLVYQGKVGYSDYSGNILFYSPSDSSYGFDGNSYALASKGNKIGLIDRKGRWLVKPKFALINQCQAATYSLSSD
jgi:WG containing repeat